MVTRTPVRGQAVRFTGEMALFRALAADTGDAFTLVELRVAPGYSAPPHRDHSFDEAFFVLQGTFMVQVGEEEHHLFALHRRLTNIHPSGCDQVDRLRCSKRATEPEQRRRS